MEEIFSAVLGAIEILSEEPLYQINGGLLIMNFNGMEMSHYYDMVSILTFTAQMTQFVSKNIKIIN